DLLAYGDRVLVELALRVLVDRLAIAAHGFLHGAALREEVGHDDAVVGVLVASLEELLVFGDGAVHVALLDELLRLPLDRHVPIHAQPSFPAAEKSRLIPLSSAGRPGRRTNPEAPSRERASARHAIRGPSARPRASSPRCCGRS